MDDSENPYQSPRDAELDPADIQSPDGNVDPRKIGKARQVPTVGVLMIVHGVLMLLAAAIMLGVMFFFAPQVGQQIEMQQQIQRQQNPNAPQFPLSKDVMTNMMYAFYGGLSAILFIVGIIGIYAGMRNRTYRGRVLGIVSLVLNMGSIMFCYCTPLSLGLLIFGLIIYLSPEADQAFQWRESHPDVP